MANRIRLVYIFAAVVLLLDCLRLFYDVPSNDEPYYGVIAMLTSIGGKPFVNENSFQQTAYLLYEPLAALYHAIVGVFGYFLFIRMTYFALLLGVAYLVFRHARRKTGEVAAVPIALVTVFSLSIIIGSLSYNTIGPFSLTTYALFFIEAVRMQSKRLAAVAGFFAFTAIAAYPTLALGVVAHGLFVCGMNRRLGRPSIRLLILAASVSAVLVTAYFSSLVLRFGLDNIQTAYKYAKDTSAMGSALGKYIYSWWLFSGYVPWFWLIGPCLIVWFWFWRKRGLSIAFVFFVFGVIMLSGIKEKPENGDWRQSFILLCAFCGAPVIWSAIRRSLADDWAEIALWSTGLITAAVTCWTSGQTLYSTNYGSALAFAAILMIGFAHEKSRFAKAALFGILALFICKKFGPLITEDATIFERTRMIEWGPLAGFFTTPQQYDYYRQMQDDIDRAAKGARTILFYDEFAAGYLMSDLKPQTIAILSHMLNQSFGVRHWQRQYHWDPAHQPDVIVRFDKQMTVNPPYYWNVHPSQFPVRDVFWSYLPEESGMYDLMTKNDYYSVFRRREFSGR